MLSGIPQPCNAPYNFGKLIVSGDCINDSVVFTVVNGTSIYALLSACVDLC